MSFLKDISLKNKKEYHKAQNFLEMGNYAEALYIFNTLLEKNYHVFYVLSNLIIIHKELNSLNVLLDKINDLMKDKQYNHEELLIQKGYVLYLLKDYDNAIECFDEVLNNDSDNSSNSETNSNSDSNNNSNSNISSKEDYSSDKAMDTLSNMESDINFDNITSLSDRIEVYKDLTNSNYSSNNNSSLKYKTNVDWGNINVSNTKEYKS